MKLILYPAGLAVLVALCAVFAGCNGGGNKTNNGAIAGAPAVSWGVMKKGSAIVNSVRYGTAGAQIVHDDSPAGESLLQDGMNVKVRGRRSSDGVTGTSEKIRAASELQGTITAAGVDTITVLGQQVFVDSRTVIANAANFQALAAGQWVVVHGMRDQLDRLLATRIEVLTSGSGPPSDRLKGVVAAPFAGGNPPLLTFALRGITIITTQGTLVQPDGATINPGDPVEVHGFLSGTTFTAGRIDREDLEDAGFDPQENDLYEGDGFVSNFTGTAADFTKEGITVRLTAGTRFEGGIAADLANNVRIVAEGSRVGGVLIADKIRFDDSVRLRANADSAGRADVLGKTVLVTGRTELNGLAGGVAGILAGQGLRISGFENPDGSITATQLIGQSGPVDINEIAVQAVVKAFDASVRTITILGITINAAGATLVGENDQIVSPDQFFSSLTVDRAIVKAEGAFSPGPPPVFTAVKVELELR